MVAVVAQPVRKRFTAGGRERFTEHKPKGTDPFQVSRRLGDESLSCKTKRPRIGSIRFFSWIFTAQGWNDLLLQKKTRLQVTEKKQVREERPLLFFVAYLCFRVSGPWHKTARVYDVRTVIIKTYVIFKLGSKSMGLFSPHFPPMLRP